MRNPCKAIGAVAALALSTHTFAGVPSLIAGLHTGDELRYTYALTIDETISLTGKTGLDAVPIRTVSTQTVIVAFRVIADTTATDIVEATFESVKVGMDTEGMKFDVDAGAPLDDKASDPARQVYGWFHPLVGTKLTLNVSPGSGEVNTVQGGEEALKASGAGSPHLQRYLDPSLFRAAFGPVFQLKSNSSMPPPGDRWYVKPQLYARGVKAPVWETRSVEVVEGDIANIRGISHASAKPEDAPKTKVFFRGVDTTIDYWWDTVRGRLTKTQGTATIGTRFDRAGASANAAGSMMQDSDMLCTWTLELIETDKSIVHRIPKPASPAAPRIEVPSAPASTPKANP
jgi:hypothetical protein